jgi:hypothetical protein
MAKSLALALERAAERLRPYEESRQEATDRAVDRDASSGHNDDALHPFYNPSRLFYMGRPVRKPKP